jgi:hypothetical protein
MVVFKLMTLSPDMETTPGLGKEQKSVVSGQLYLGELTGGAGGSRLFTAHLPAQATSIYQLPGNNNLSN